MKRYDDHRPDVDESLVGRVRSIYEVTRNPTASSGRIGAGGPSGWDRLPLDDEAGVPPGCLAGPKRGIRPA